MVVVNLWMEKDGFGLCGMSWRDQRGNFGHGCELTWMRKFSGNNAGTMYSYSFAGLGYTSYRIVPDLTRGPYLCGGVGVNIFVLFSEFGLGLGPFRVNHWNSAAQLLLKVGLKLPVDLGT